MHWRAHAPWSDTLHCEYMALTKHTSVSREAMLLSFEPRRFGAAEYADIFEAMLKYQGEPLV